MVTAVLKDGYFDENVNNNQITFYIGNVYYKNDKAPLLKQIEILFNEEAFYKLMNSYNITT